MAAPKIRNMEEFATLSGISRPTVSKYFHDPSSVRASTRKRIEAALEQYDYRPNIFAVNQNRKLTKYVGIVVPYLTDPFFAEIARYLEARCVAAGYRPTLYSSYGDPAQEIEILDGLRSLKPAGVLLAPLGRASDKAEVERFCRDVPTVLFDSNLEGLGEAFIGSDNHSFVQQSVEYLTRDGDVPFLFEMANPANPNANKRRSAFVSEMTARGLDPRIVSVEGEGWAFEEIARTAMTKLISEGGLPSSTILCSNDRLAIGVLAACYASGLRVGRGDGCALKVASHDDHPYSRFTNPALTTVAHDYIGVSDRTVQTMLELIDSGGHLSERAETLFPARLIVRDSA